MENLAVEWKESWHDEYMRTICAFANASGGVLEVGRRDNGEIAGVSNATKLLEDLPNKIKSAMAIIPDIEALESDKKQYIRIGVGAYPFPISYHGVYYIRSGSTTQALTGSALDEFILRKHGKTWDAVPEPYAKFDDFEKDAFRAFRSKAIGSARLTERDLDITDEVLLDNLMCTEKNYLKRAAVLLFHQKPEKWVLGSYVKVGLFANAADLVYQDEIHGPLITMADKVEDLVYLKYFKGLISYQGIQRIETYPIPRAAFREAVLNAIVHKDYSTGNPIHIHIYPDKVLIYNDGRLPDRWTVDNLLIPHTSKPYNPLIAAAFFRSGQIEAWGRGIQKITDACIAWGKPDPFFKICPNEVMIGFNVDPAGIVGGTDANIVENGENIVENGGSIVENGGNIVENGYVNPLQAKILELMRDNPKITAKTIAEKTGMTSRNVQIHIKTLTTMGLIERVGARKKGHWTLKLPE